MSVTVYGPHVGYDSYEVVTRGYKYAADQLGCCAGWVETGRPWEEEDDSGWYGSESAVLCGPYTQLHRLAFGGHTRKAVVFAPNSTWVPDAFFKVVRDNCVDHVVVPSSWAKSVLLTRAPDWFDTPVSVAPHGVSPEFRTHGGGEVPLVTWGSTGKFLVAHFAGSACERKGTGELVKAFKVWRHRADAVLWLVVNPSEAEGVYRLLRHEGLDVGDAYVTSRLNVPPGLMSWLYAGADLVCQPSRAEGFGLVPLEALACGTPVAITLCTGHVQYASYDDELLGGVVPICVGPESRVEYDPGGSAPSVDPGDIVGALELAFELREQCKRAAVDNSEWVRTEYSWAKTTREFFKVIGELA